MEKVTFSVQGMACGGCSGTVKQALLALDGVIDAAVSHADSNAVVEYDPARVQPDQMIAAIRRSGYTVA